MILTDGEGKQHTLAGDGTQSSQSITVFSSNAFVYQSELWELGD